MVRFIRSTMPFIQGLYGLICLFSMPLNLQIPVSMVCSKMKNGLLPLGLLELCAQ